jgi:signal transduction histidine kinase
MDRKANAQQSCDITTRLRLPGGRFLSMQVQLFPQLDDSGRVMAYSGICRDTTEMKHTERLLQLETTKAQEVEMVKNKFLHNMCYEIRTPLNTVVGFAEMFENEHSYEDEEKYIEEIKKNSSYLLDLINDILFLSRLDAHMVEINKEFTDFAKTFEAHCHMGLGTNRKEGVNYVAENKYNKLIVNIDDANVGRILQQVIQNATKLTTHGTVRAHYEYIGGKLIIAVDDTGPGISPKKLEHIFERFNTPGNNDHGTGLGLPICKELVTQLGGTIDINSEVGKGTTVWITLPCEASEIEHKVF